MKEYNICYSLDSNYTQQMCTSITSILINSNSDENFIFYILDGGLSDEDKSKIESLRKIKNFYIKYILMNNNDFKDCPILSDYHVTLPTYYRFLLPDILLKHDKVLYLDCDTVVRGSLEPLFEEFVDNFAAMMVLDAESEKESKRLGLKKYFNAGVMLINLDYWRKNDIKTKLFDYAKNNHDKILWQDQDIINSVLQDSDYNYSDELCIDDKGILIKQLPNKYNYQYFQYENVDNNEIKDSVILHLAGRFKPWLMPFESEIYDEYYEYLKFTPFKNRIIEYRLNASGKRLKNNKGGNYANIVLNASNDDINKFLNKINSETDLKFSEMYSYTNSQAANLYKEVTSASNIIEHNLNNKIIDINRFTGEINAELKDLKDTVGFLPTTESIDKLKENLMNIIEKMELQYSLNLDNLKNDFENQLNNQRLKYEKKLIDMEETIEKLNDDLKALKKNPIERFLVKFGKKKEYE